MTADRRRALLVCGAAAAWGMWVCAHAFTRAVPWHAPLLDHSIHGVPFWREAALRAFMAWAGAGATALAAWQLGRLLTAGSRDLFESAAECAQFTLAVGAVALSSLFVLMAWAGAYRPPLVIALLIVCAVSRPMAFGRGLRGGWNLVTRHASAPRAGVEWIWVGLAALACTFALVGALAPEVEYDALWYHLWLPDRWLAAGRLVDIVPEYVSLYPGGWEVLNGAAMSIGGPVAAKLLHFACLPLVGAAAYLLACRAARGVSSGLVAAICMSAPTSIWEASTAYVDLALAWFTTLTGVALWHYVDTRDRRWLVVCGTVAGGALGVKHLALIALAICAAWMVAVNWRRESPAAALRATMMFVALSIALASPWYLRAYAASGNPVFPQLYGLFGAWPATRWSEGSEQALAAFNAHFGMGRSAAALLALPWDLTTHAARFGGTYGPVFLVLAPVALIGPDRRRLVVLAVSGAAYVAFWASPLGSMQARFLAPLVPIGAVLAAAGAAQLFAGARRLSPRLVMFPIAAVAMLLILNLPTFIDWHEKERRGWDFWLTHVLHAVPAAVVVGAESEEAYLARTVLTYSAWRAIDAGTPPDSRVLTFAGGDQLYAHRDRLWSDSTVAHDATWGAPAGYEPAMLAALGRLKVTHVLIDKSARTQNAIAGLAVASETTRRCCLVPLFEDERSVVYRVEYGSVTAPHSGAKP